MEIHNYLMKRIANSQAAHAVDVGFFIPTFPKVKLIMMQLFR